MFTPPDSSSSTTVADSLKMHSTELISTTKATLDDSSMTPGAQTLPDSTLLISSPAVSTTLSEDISTMVQLMNSNIASVLIGVGAAIGLLLLFLSIAICILAAVLVFNKKKKKFSSWSPNSDTNNNHTIREETLQPYYSLPRATNRYDQNDQNELQAGHVQVLSMPSATPKSPVDSNFISLNEWRKEQALLDNDPVLNPIYTGSDCGSECNELLQYETVDEAKTTYRLQDNSLLHVTPLRQTSQIQEKTKLMDGPHEIKSSCVNYDEISDHTTQQVDRSSQESFELAGMNASLSPSKVQAAWNIDFEVMENPEDDECVISNCHYEATRFTTDREEEQIMLGSKSSINIYELDDDALDSTLGNKGNIGENNAEGMDNQNNTFTLYSKMDTDHQGQNYEKVQKEENGDFSSHAVSQPLNLIEGIPDNRIMEKLSKEKKKGSGSTSQSIGFVEEAALMSDDRKFSDREHHFFNPDCSDTIEPITSLSKNNIEISEKVLN